MVDEKNDNFKYMQTGPQMCLHPCRSLLYSKSWDGSKDQGREDICLQPVHNSISLDLLFQSSTI